MSVPPLPRRLSLIDQTTKCLREGIRDGHWGAHLPGERELCAELHVGRNTLRAALRELEREGCLEAMHGRRRRIVQVSTVRTATPRVVGIISPCPFVSLTAPLALMADTLQRSFARSGWRTDFHASAQAFGLRPGTALTRLTSAHPAAVWVAFGSVPPMQQWFLKQKLPLLVAGSCPAGAGITSIDTDFHAACHHAGALLLRKGHRRIALVLPKNAYGGDMESERGLREALAAMPGASLAVLRHNGTASHLRKLLDEAFDARFPPTAFLVTRVNPALTVFTHLMHLGKRIPEEVAVISRDDHPCLSVLSPDMTRYSIEPAWSARRLVQAARTLLETGSHPAKAIRLLPRLIKGETV